MVGSKDGPTRGGRTNRDERGLEDEPVIHVEISGVWYEEDLGVDVLDDLGERRVQPRVRNRIEERGGEPVEEDRLANPERTIRLHGLSPHALHRCLVEHRRLAASDDAHIDLVPFLAEPRHGGARPEYLVVRMRRDDQEPPHLQRRSPTPGTL